MQKDAKRKLMVIMRMRKVNLHMPPVIILMQKDLVHMRPGNIPMRKACKQTQAVLDLMQVDM